MGKIVKISKVKAAEKIFELKNEGSGKFFSVSFRKKDGSIREMKKARFGVKKNLANSGKGLAFDPKKIGRIPVTDMGLLLAKNVELAKAQITLSNLLVEITTSNEERKAVLEVEAKKIISMIKKWSNEKGYRFLNYTDITYLKISGQEYKVV